MTVKGLPPQSTNSLVHVEEFTENGLSSVLLEFGPYPDEALLSAYVPDNMNDLADVRMGPMELHPDLMSHLMGFMNTDGFSFDYWAIFPSGNHELRWTFDGGGVTVEYSPSWGLGNVDVSYSPIQRAIIPAELPGISGSPLPAGVPLEEWVYHRQRDINDDRDIRSPFYRAPWRNFLPSDF